MKKAIIIGNGPSCLEYEYGDQIDSGRFGDIIRINRGYKQDNDSLNEDTFKHVGQKTDIWACSDLRLHIAKARAKELSKILVCFPAFKWNDTIAKETEKEHTNIIVIPPDYEDWVNSLVSFKPKWPSTGILTLAAAIENYDEVVIHGFDAYDFKYDTHHFFEDKPNKYKFSNTSDHSGLSEKEFLSLVQEKYNVKQLKDII